MHARILCLALLASSFTTKDISADETVVSQLDKSQPTKIRLAAMRRLHEKPEDKDAPKAIPALRLCLQEKDVDIRSNALAALAAIAIIHKLPCPIELVEALLDPNESIYSTAYTYCAFDKYPAEALPYFVKALNAVDPGVRQIATTNLSYFPNDPRALAALRQAAKDKDLSVRNNAHVALWKLTNNFADLIRFRLEVLGTVKPEKLTENDPAHAKKTHASNALIYIATEKQLEEFSRTRADDLIEVVVELLQDKSPIIRASAARVLGQIVYTNPNSLLALRKLQVPQKLARQSEDDPEQQVRTEAKNSGIAIALAPDWEQDKHGIRQVLDNQVKAWNKADLAGFMEGYWNSPQLSFFSGGKVTRGWQATLDRYRKQYQGEGKDMGKLAFTDLEIDVLSHDHALARGRWQLDLAKEKVGGLFTLVLRKFPPGWRIIHDHTSR